MRYFKVVSSSKILCTFKRCTWMRHEIIHRSKDIAGNPAIALHPSPEVPSERDYGPLVEIDEAEALAMDPELFRDGFQDYEEYKRWEAERLPTPAQKRKEAEPAKQETLF